MISRDQIHRLESKVQKAVEYIDRLKTENERLRSSLSAYETRIDELERRIDEIRADQSEIERGVLSALDQLERVDEQAAAGPAESNTVVSAHAEESEDGAEALEADPGRLVRTVDSEDDSAVKEKTAESPVTADNEQANQEAKLREKGPDPRPETRPETRPEEPAEKNTDDDTDGSADDASAEQENELDIF